MTTKSVDRMRLMLMILGMATLSPAAALAEENGQAEAREKRQDARIEEGTKSGVINPAEARRIGHQQHRIDHAQNQASRKIYRAKHNRR